MSAASIGLPPTAPPPGSCSSGPGSPCTWATRQRTWPSPWPSRKEEGEPHGRCVADSLTMGVDTCAQSPVQPPTQGAPAFAGRTPPSPLCSAPLPSRVHRHCAEHLTTWADSQLCGAGLRDTGPPMGLPWSRVLEPSSVRSQRPHKSTTALPPPLPPCSSSVTPPAPHFSS